MAVVVRLVSLCTVLLFCTRAGLAEDQHPKSESKEDAVVKGTQVELVAIEYTTMKS